MGLPGTERSLGRREVGDAGETLKKSDIRYRAEVIKPCGTTFINRNRLISVISASLGQT